MKHFLIVCTLALFAYCDAQIDKDVSRKIIDKISKMAETKIEAAPNFSIYDPFKEIEKVIPKTQESSAIPSRTVPELGGTINDMAFLRGKWRCRGQKVGAYIIIDVRNGSVVLQDDRKKHYLVVHQNKGFFDNAKESDVSPCKEPKDGNVSIQPEN